MAFCQKNSSQYRKKYRKQATARKATARSKERQLTATSITFRTSQPRFWRTWRSRPELNRDQPLRRRRRCPFELRGHGCSPRTSTGGVTSRTPDSDLVRGVVTRLSQSASLAGGVVAKGRDSVQGFCHAVAMPLDTPIRPLVRNIRRPSSRQGVPEVTNRGPNLCLVRNGRPVATAWSRRPPKS